MPVKLFEMACIRRQAERKPCMPPRWGLMRNQPERAAAYRAVGRNRVTHAAASTRRYGVAQVSPWGIVSRKENARNITDRDRRLSALPGLPGSAPEYAKGNNCADHAVAALAKRTRSRRTVAGNAVHDAHRQ